MNAKFWQRDKPEKNEQNNQKKQPKGQLRRDPENQNQLHKLFLRKIESQPEIKPKMKDFLLNRPGRLQKVTKTRIIKYPEKTFKY